MKAGRRQPSAAKDPHSPRHKYGRGSRLDVISFVRPITALRSITQQTLDAPRQMLQAMSRKLNSLAAATHPTGIADTVGGGGHTAGTPYTLRPPPPSGKNCLQNPSERRCGFPAARHH